MSSANFSTSNDTYRQRMGNGLIYKVPPFQRDYSWDTQEWDDLWQDIIGLFGNEAEPAHYMGYLVLQSSNSKEFDIIDGQQRLTTISLMILAAIKRLNELSVVDEKNAERSNQLRNAYIGYLDAVTLVSKPKLVLNRHNNSFYENYLVPLERIPQRGLNASEHLLRKSFTWFFDRIKAHCKDSGEDVARFIDQIVDKLFFTVITVTDELNAFKVFETLNARGVRLSSTDLLKNYLFAVVHSERFDEIEINNLEDRWEAIVGILENERFPDFLRIYWNSKNPLVRSAELFKTIKKHIDDRKKVFSLIRDLDQNARVYKALRDSTDKFWSPKQKDYLEELKMFNVRQPLSLLLAAYARYGDSEPDNFTKVLRAVTVISFRYNVICNMQANEQERIYGNIAVGISRGELSSPREIIQELQKVYPEDNRFRTAFEEKDFKTTSSRNKKVVKYILTCIERQSGGAEHNIESDSITLEHILPENPSGHWEASFSDPEHERFVYRLGNMTLLNKSRNRDIGNASYNEKYQIYQQSTFNITQKIAEEYDEWTPQKIENRQKWMARQATSIWRIDLS